MPTTLSNDQRLRAGRLPWWKVAAAIAVVGSAVAAAVLLVGSDDGDLRPATPVTDPATSVSQPTGTTESTTVAGASPLPVKNGWLALESDGDIYLVRPGEDARRIAVAGSDTTNEACPAWSPDGTRLLFGRVTLPEDANTGLTAQPDVSDAELVIVPVAGDGAPGAPTVIALEGFDVLDGGHRGPHPCGVWAPDSRWVALPGATGTWVIDTHTSEIRRLPGLRALDLEWRPGTDELAMALDVDTTPAEKYMNTPVSVYSVSTGEIRQLGSIRAGSISWSPDGSTLAYTGVNEPPDEIPSGLWLIDADGTNQRLLSPSVAGAPLWSPTGDHIASSRPISPDSERTVVVLVSVADGALRDIEPRQSDASGQIVQWYPRAVTWSPDGTTLLYQAWSTPVGGYTNSLTTLVLVPVDTPSDVMTINDWIDDERDYKYSHITNQTWGRQPR